jgi:hypothetical protein
MKFLTILNFFYLQFRSLKTSHLNVIERLLTLPPAALKGLLDLNKVVIVVTLLDYSHEFFLNYKKIHITFSKSNKSKQRFYN